MTTITNHHKLGGLKEKKLILSHSEGQMSEIKVSAGQAPSGALSRPLEAAAILDVPGLTPNPCLYVIVSVCLCLLLSNLPLPHA